MKKFSLGLKELWNNLKNPIKPYKIEKYVYRLIENNPFIKSSYKYDIITKRKHTYSVLLRQKWYGINKDHLNPPTFIDNHNVTEKFYNSIYLRNCENVIGYVPLPVGLVGPLSINHEIFQIPIATTEGGLVASLNRGCKILMESFQFQNKLNQSKINKYNLSPKSLFTVDVTIMDRGMTRAPLLEFPNIGDLPKFIHWVEINFPKIKEVFNSTTRYGSLQEIQCFPIGKTVHLRLRSLTGEAMGMNMVSRGAEAVVLYLSKKFPDMRILSLSGNVCTDKKSSVLNLATGRGKMALANVIISEKILRKLTQISPAELVKLNIEKNLIGSAIVGSIGGQNAHVSNIIAGIYAATGQDLGHIISSSNCISNYQINKQGDLDISLTFPVLELGTVGGGTELPTQRKYLELMGIQNYKNNPTRTTNYSSDSENKLAESSNKLAESSNKLAESSNKLAESSNKLAGIVAGTCLAGELSLMIALSKGDLIKAHFHLNRK